MHLNKKTLKMAVCAVLALTPAAMSAQSSSINAFSPYSFYGIGDIMTQGTAATRSMGGTGVAFRSWTEINYLNPASYSAINRNSALLSVGGQGQNYYLRQDSGDKTLKSSYNTFNLSDIGFAIPLAKNLGFGVVVAPYSSVGYRVTTNEENPEVLADVGYISYLYEGEGGVTQFKAGIGWKFLDRVSVGADLIYYHGNITRYVTQQITGVTGSGYYQSASGEKSEKVSSLFATFGLQADLISKPEAILTFGATYKMGGKLNSKVSYMIPFVPAFYTGGNYIDAARHVEETSDFSLPHIFSGGLFMHKPKWSLGADYTYAMWGDVNQPDFVNNVSFRDTHTVSVGARFIPNPGDVRRFMNRWTYRFGARYGNYYMNMNEGKTAIDEMAFTFGIGIPLNAAGLNKVDLGLELGRRGTKKNGLIQENFFKFSVAFSLFGEDFWFVKHKYD